MNGRRGVPRALALGAVSIGLAAGSYGVASAATGSTTSTTTTTVPSTGAPPGGRGAWGGRPAGAAPWGRQRSDETLLTGDALAKVTAIAQDKVPGGTIVRVETDADGNAAYEAHMVTAAGARATVYVDNDFGFVRVDTR